MESLLAIIIIYTLSIFIIKKTGWGKKKKCEDCNNCCPNCQFTLSIVRRRLTDHLVENMTFRVFNFKRYMCSNCEWKGLRWEEKFTTY